MLLYFQKPDGRVTVGCDPDAGEVVVVDPVLEELPSAVLVNIHATGQAIVYIALYHCRIGSCLHLKTGDPVVVDVVAVKVTLQAMPSI